VANLPRERILGLHRLLEHLVREQLDFVAAPITADDGSTLIRDGGFDWQVEPWKPGIADFHNHPSAARLSAAMDALARWHLSAERHVPAASAAVWFRRSAAEVSPTVCERIGMIAEIQSPTLGTVVSGMTAAMGASISELTGRILSLVQRCWPGVQRELQSMRGILFRLQPCLRDVWHDHVLFSGDQVTGLIDPSACRRENVACDLSRLIGSMVGDDRTRWNHALTEYQRHRDLTVSELKLIEVLDRSSVLLSGWTWLKWIYVEKRSFPDWDAVMLRLGHIMERLQHLVAGDGETFKLIVP
jgi:Ser/Thr protein kinase RdoA (MazF antagonist)